MRHSWPWTLLPPQTGVSATGSAARRCARRSARRASGPPCARWRCRRAAAPPRPVARPPAGARRTSCCAPARPGRRGRSSSPSPAGSRRRDGDCAVASTPAACGTAPRRRAGRRSRSPCPADRPQREAEHVEHTDLGDDGGEQLRTLGEHGAGEQPAVRSPGQREVVGSVQPVSLRCSAAAIASSKTCCLFASRPASCQSAAVLAAPAQARDRHDAAGRREREPGRLERRRHRRAETAVAVEPGRVRSVAAR